MLATDTRNRVNNTLTVKTLHEAGRTYLDAVRGESISNIQCLCLPPYVTANSTTVGLTPLSSQLSDMVTI